MSFLDSLFGGGNKVTTTNSSQTSNPWDPSVAGLMNITGGVNQLSQNYMPNAIEQGAYGVLNQNAGNGDPYTSQKFGLASDLYGGGTDRTGMVNNAYTGIMGQLSPYINGSTDPYSNPAFTKFTQGMTNDITDQIKSQYAGAGYSGVNTGDFGKQLGEGISRGVAPAFLQANSDLENRKLGAISAAYGAGNTTAGLLSGLDQTALGNRQAGLGVGDQALQAQNYGPNQQLAIQSALRGIPINQLSALTSIAAPIAQLGGTKSGTGTQTQNNPFGLGALLPLAFMGGTGGFGTSMAGGLLGGLGKMFGSSSSSSGPGPAYGPGY